MPMIDPRGPEAQHVQASMSEAKRVRLGHLAAEVESELGRQRQKWGIQEHEPDFWFLIASEEIGEVAKAICEREPRAARREIVQAIAVLAQLHHALRDRTTP